MLCVSPAQQHMQQHRHVTHHTSHIQHHTCNIQCNMQHTTCNIPYIQHTTWTHHETCQSYDTSSHAYLRVIICALTIEYNFITPFLFRQLCEMLHHPYPQFRSSIRTIHHDIFDMSHTSTAVYEFRFDQESGCCDDAMCGGVAHHGDVDEVGIRSDLDRGMDMCLLNMACVACDMMRCDMML